MIDRATVIGRSVEAFAKDQLFGVRTYPQEQVVFLDAYPSPERMSRPLDRNYIAVEAGPDDGGRQAELGSALKRRLYTFDFYVFGKSRVWGKNLASVLRFSLEGEQVINLLDSDGTTTIGHVDVDFVSAQPAITRTPRPWEEHAWITRLRVEDFWSSAGGN